MHDIKSPGTPLLDFENLAEAQATLPKVTRYEVLGYVRRLRKYLGLTHTDINVLATLVSFLPLKDSSKQELPVSAHMMLTVFASNKTICERVGDLNERSLRRSVEKLGELGLLCRKDSATKKRYPTRRNGEIMGAYGLDMSPLFAHAKELRTLAESIEQQKENQREIRSTAVNLRAQIMLRLNELSDAARDYVIKAATILRRVTLKIEDLFKILEELQKHYNTLPQHIEKTNNLSVGNGQIDRHTNKIENLNKKTSTTSNNPDEKIQILETIENCHEIKDLIDTNDKTIVEIKHQILIVAIGTGCDRPVINRIIETVGWTKLIEALNIIAKRLEYIQNISGYLLQIALPAGKA